MYIIDALFVNISTDQTIKKIIKTRKTHQEKFWGFLHLCYVYFICTNEVRYLIGAICTNT